MKISKSINLVALVILMLIVGSVPFTSKNFLDVKITYAKNTTAVFDQKHFRFRDDDGSESAATWLAAEDIDITGMTKSTNFRLRIETAETASASPTASVTPRIEYKAASGTCSDGSWTVITTSTTNAFALSASSNFVGPAATTEQLSASQGGANFIAGEIFEASNPGSAVTGMSKDWTEHEWSMQATTNAGDGSAYLFRVTDNGTALNAYSVCPQLTVAAANSAPSAPTQNTPSDTATGVSTTPNFLMTATDADSDDLGYKVTLYSATGCSASLVSTHDQAVTSTGWASTDATCTGNPTSCYASGTQADFALQIGDILTASTQYWWRASAQDPDGTNSFTDSSTCNTFTTAAANSAPNAPTQNSPSDTATGVSITPNFLMTATDPDSDDLGYKVTIYSVAGCSASLVSTHDQAVTSTGWTSTDASCTIAPTSCYASNTQGDFVLQSGDQLSNNTQYWWKASAQDPDGTNSFTDSASCNSFTTEVVPSLTFSISDNSIGFGTLSSSNARYANGAGTGSASEVEAHTITASTNGGNGYVITLSGSTLTYSSDTIAAIGSANTTSSVGTEQFGLRMIATGGNGSVSAPYAASGFAFDTASFPDEIASDADGDNVTTTYSVRYLANITSNTEAGDYSTTLNYIVTGSF